MELNSTIEVFTALKQLTQTTEIVLEDGKFTFADVGTVIAFLSTGAGQKLIANFPQMVKELSDLQPSETAQVAGWVHSFILDVQNVVKKAQ